MDVLLNLKDLTERECEIQRNTMHM